MRLCDSLFSYVFKQKKRLTLDKCGRNEIRNSLERPIAARGTFFPPVNKKRETTLVADTQREGMTPLVIIKN